MGSWIEVIEKQNFVLLPRLSEILERFLEIEKRQYEKQRRFLK